MSWVVLGLAATVLGSIVVTIDKIVVERYRETPWIYAYFMSFFLCVYSVLLLLVRRRLGLFDVAASPLALIALLPGILHFINAVLYTRALLWTDAATVQAISQLRPVFAVLWGFLIFHDVFVPAAYAGVTLIVVCCVLLSLEHRTEIGRHLRFSRSYKYLVVAALLHSISDLSTKLALGALSYWDTFILNRMGTLLPLVLVFCLPPTRRIVFESLRLHGARFLLLVALIEVGAMFSLFLTVIAFSRGPLALVAATVATTPIFVLVYTELLRHVRVSAAAAVSGHTPTFRRWVLLVGIVSGVYFMSVEG